MNMIKRCRYGLMNFPLQDIWQGRSLETYGEFSESEVAVFRKIIKPKDTVVEIGGSIGCHTVAFSRIVGPEGGVLVFEPERHSFYMLCGNIAINNITNVFAFHQAIAEKIGTLIVPEVDIERTENIGCTELEMDWSKGAHYPVACNTLDNLSLNALNFLKIDVEGMEQRVLQGAAETIKKFQPVIYCESDRQEKMAALRQYIWSLDYEIYDHAAPLYNPDNVAGQKEDLFQGIVSINLLCLPKSRKFEFDPAEFGMTVNHNVSELLTENATSETLEPISISDPGNS